MPLRSIWNMKLDDIASTWSTLEPQLRAATFKELFDSGWFHLLGHFWKPTDTTTKQYTWGALNSTGDQPVKDTLVLAQVTKVVKPLAAVERFATNSDTEVNPFDGANSIGGYIISAYQNSGGAVTLKIVDGAGNSIHEQSINSGAITMLTTPIPAVLFGANVGVKWSAAAGASQWIGIQEVENA